MVDLELTDKKTVKIKGRSFEVLSYVLLLAMMMMATVAFFSPELIPKDELSPEELIGVCTAAGIAFLFSAIFARRERVGLSYVLFFGAIYLGVLYALISTPQPLQFQNSIIIFMTSHLIATFFMNKGQLIFAVATSLAILYTMMIVNGINPSLFLPSFLFFHIFSFSALWISWIGDKIENHILMQGKRDAKLKEIGFVSGSIAHEINNPLSILTSSVRRLVKTYESDEDLNPQREKTKKYVDSVHRGVDRISEIVQSMYSLIRQSGDVQTPTIKASEVAEGLQVYVDDLIQKYHVPIVSNFTPEKDVLLEANAGELIQVLTNLMRNACRSVEKIEGAKVWIDFEILEEEFSISVRDTGDGPPAKIANQLGSAFNSGSTEGLGLGLSVSMVLAEKNKGQLRFMIEKKLTTFKLVIPYLPCSKDLPLQNILKAFTSRQANLALLKENIVFIVMKPSENQITLSDLKEMIQDQIKLLDGVTPYKFIVDTGAADMSNQAKLYFSSNEMKKLFISGAIIGQHRAAISAINIFTQILRLPYPMKLFGDFKSAYDWTLQVDSLNGMEN